MKRLLGGILIFLFLFPKFFFFSNSGPNFANVALGCFVYWTGFLCMRKDFHQEDGQSSDLDQKRSGIQVTLADHEENGTESQS